MKQIATKSKKQSITRPTTLKLSFSFKGWLEKGRMYQNNTITNAVNTNNNATNTTQQNVLQQGLQPQLQHQQPQRTLQQSLPQQSTSGIVDEGRGIMT